MRILDETNGLMIVLLISSRRVKDCKNREQLLLITVFFSS